jgi:ribosomal protein S18 acetylase RimI-like enzyme
VAVDAGLQGLGIGSRLLEQFCARVDAAGEAAYLETDKPINVRFYDRFGFAVIGQQAVLGTPNWFMRRPPRSAEVGPRS